MGWAGGDSLSPVYAQSNFQAFIATSNLPQIAGQCLSRFWQQLDEKTGHADASDTLKKLVPLMLHHPMAAYVADLSLGDQEPHGNAAVICDVGTDAAEIESDLKSLNKIDAAMRVTTRDSIITVTFDDSSSGLPAQTLMDKPEFVAAMKPLQVSPAIAMYVDIAAILKNADAAADRDEKARTIWPKVREALGFAKAQSFALTAGFAGPNWMTTARLTAPLPRIGLLAVVEPKPIDPVLLARIPATATSVSVYDFDAKQFVDTVANAMAVNPDSDRVFHQAMGLATIGLGRNFRNQVVAPLGPQWVTYVDATSHDTVILNHPTDNDTASDALVSSLFGLVNLANSFVPGARQKPVVNADQQSIKGIDVTSAVTAQMSPSFAAKDGVLYFGSSPKSVVTAANVIASRTGDDLLNGPKFVGTEALFETPVTAAFDYFDLPATAEESFAKLVDEFEQLQKLLAVFDIDVPRPEFNNFDQIRDHLSPGLSICGGDAEGIYFKSVSPFPGSTCLLGDAAGSMATIKNLTAIAALVQPYITHH